ncbi:LTA synthase family protein [[Clostridium] fimetarium]|uniref:Phosphoglycerol transferase MdoB n=1 Tax=[Clostridium] fimetarium TaxID=99656 RepID=A0A1I0NJT9_9FIRM|nr:LTA synthase family protein [[Clostridium] fimetarium]SEW01656.1 Phosphoglycerol transferase MdoB [[Clostridium] fimetarium]
MKEKLKPFVKRKLQSELLQIALIGIILNLIIECLSRRSLMGVLTPFTNPIIFIYNAFIIMTTLSLALLIKKKIFTYTLVSVLWLACGITDFVVLAARKTPFTAMDLYLIKDAIKIIPIYMNTFQIGATILGIVLVIVALVIWWFKSPIYKGKMNYFRSAAKFGIMAAGLTLATNALLLNSMLEDNFGNLGNAYKQYGFAYCFSCSVLSRGISKPDNYSVESIQQLKAQIESNSTEKENEQPNIIFLQLESFMDPNLIKGVTFSENPVPNFEELIKNYSCGYLWVPCVGAGTANTEFEVQTGMNIDDFGPGEYPYRTVMQSTACESTAYNLKKLGYTAEAIHNNDATFYDRYKVFANLGYDTFTSIEFMNVTEKTPTGWAKDKILTSQITQALDSTQTKDYVYSISVQGHGDYPSTFPAGFTPKITAQGFFDLDATQAFDYYINQLNEMDTFIKELTDELSKRDEKTILVLYGDHLPGFSFENENLKNADIYQTQYVIWDNYGLPGRDLSLQAYQLSAHVLDKIGITEGIVTKFHQKQMGTANYLKDLKLLEYDLLYGDCDAYNGINPFKPTILQMGTNKISVEKAYNYKDYFCIEGSNFNDFSVVMVNGKEYSTEVINGDLLKVKDYNLKDSDIIYIIQRGEDKIELSRTKGFLYKKSP